MTEVKINPKYEHLRGFIERISKDFEQMGRETYRGRNVIRVISAPDGEEVNVKRFHKPQGINRFVYSWNIRKPKGQRAYSYTFPLNGKGIHTPEAIALIENRNAIGLLGYSYLVTKQSDYPYTLKDLKDDTPAEEYEGLAKSLARFTVQIHRNDIFHKDFTPGNILWEKVNGEYHFSLVDINRMYFGKVSVRKGIASLTRFWGPKGFTEVLVREYATLRNADPDESVVYAMKLRSAFWHRYGRKHRIPFRIEY